MKLMWWQSDLRDKKAGDNPALSLFFLSADLAVMSEIKVFGNPDYTIGDNISTDG